MQRRKLNLKAEVESTISHFSFKRLAPGGFNSGLIGSTCTGPPKQSKAQQLHKSPDVAAQAEFETII